MMKRLLFYLVIASLASCRLAPGRMFETPKDYPFAADSTSKMKGPYIIQSEDKIEFNIFSNEGFKLIDVTTSNITQSANDEGILYSVDENGEIKFPVIGRVKVEGLSISDAEALLQEKYSLYYKDPFVLLRVVSRKALVFLGDGGKGTVVPLTSDHTTLFEALALAGGLSDYSKAYEIKIIRGDLKNPKVYLANVSTIEGLRNSELQIYPNDIIYIDSASNFRKRLTTELIPYLSVFTTVFAIFTYLKIN